MIHIKTLFGSFLLLSAVYIVFYWTNNFSSKTHCKSQHTRATCQEIPQDIRKDQDILNILNNQTLKETSLLDIISKPGYETTTKPQSNNTGTAYSARRTTNDALRNTSKAKCQPVKHILFLKTHKTGGSTITNILNRYGDAKNLSFALPFQGHLYTFVWPARFRFTYTAPLYGTEYNILCNHARYNRRPMNWLFPKQKAKYISILRDPVAQYESVFNFMHFANALGYADEEDPLETFLKFPISFHEIRPLMKKKNVALHLVRNPMSFDLGLDFKYYQNLTAVQSYIQFLEHEFDLVMIMEHFDESLVLMKRLLCWKMKDILYFKLNERQDKQKRGHLSKQVKQDIRSWNRADVILYEHFNRTLWKKIEEQGPTFYKDLELFRKKNKDLRDACLQKGEFLDEAYTGVYVKGYAIRKDIPKKKKKQCEKLMRNEISFVKYFRQKRIKGIKSIEEPDEYLDAPENNWDQGTDLEHEPELSGSPERDEDASEDEEVSDR